MTVHEFDAQVLGGVLFDAAGLIVAERDGKPVGFVHAGFGPDTPIGGPLSLSHGIGTVCMLVVAPDVNAPEVEDELLARATQYLRNRGASVIYAGGQFPLNPYYWGVYGGSEWAGILGMHVSFHTAVVRAGFEPVSTCVLLDADLSQPEVRDPRTILYRRQSVLEVTEDALPSTWWTSLAIGDFRLTLYRLLSKSGGNELARATTWDMAWFGRNDGRIRLALVDMEVHTAHRRKGYGRHLVNEILHAARAQSADVVSLQTRSTNTAALALYEAIGFCPVETATLYRLPGGVASNPA